MIPADKAKEISDTKNWWMCDKEQSKQQAILVTEELIKRWKNRISENAAKECEYWEEVKEELNKM